MLLLLYDLICLWKEKTFPLLYDLSLEKKSCFVAI